MITLWRGAFLQIRQPIGRARYDDELLCADEICVCTVGFVLLMYDDMDVLYGTKVEGDG